MLSEDQFVKDWCERMGDLCPFTAKYFLEYINKRDAAQRAQADARPVLYGCRNVETGVVLTVTHRTQVGAATAASARTDNYAKFEPVELFTAPPAESAGVKNSEADLQRVYDAFGIGAKARGIGTLMMNIENVRRFADYLHAVEHEFFMVPGEPDDDHPEEEPAPECLVNSWGSTQAQYIEQFRAALATLSRTHAADGEAGNTVLANLVNAVRWWGSQEDGIPAEVAPAYNAAHLTLGWELSHPMDFDAANKQAAQQQAEPVGDDEGEAFSAAMKIARDLGNHASYAYVWNAALQHAAREQEKKTC